MTKDQCAHMEKAYGLALQGLGTVTPNPLVGAVIADEQGNSLAEGYHQLSGGPHAEVVAINQALEAGHSLQGKTLYCSLEPCCHTKKLTPPCTELIIKHQFRKVVIGNLDPNPQVAGKGVERLRQAGIDVEISASSAVGEEINRVFFHVMRNKTPYLHLKIAQTLDGRISSSTGDSKWITDMEARTQVHRWRYEYDAVMVGSGTLNADNPSLDIRLVDGQGKIPYRIICGTPQKLNWDSKVLADQHTARTLLLCTSKQWESTSELIKNLIVQRKISVVSGSTLSEGFKKLLDFKISSVLCEGGAHLASSLIEEALVNRLSIFMAPKLMGNGPIFYQQHHHSLMSQAKTLKKIQWRPYGEQICFQGDF